MYKIPHSVLSKNFQVHQYFTICSRYFLSKFEQFSLISRQHSLKSGGNKYKLRLVKVPGIVPYWKAYIQHKVPIRLDLFMKIWSSLLLKYNYNWLHTLIMCKHLIDWLIVDSFPVEWSLYSLLIVRYGFQPIQILNIVRFKWIDK